MPAPAKSTVDWQYARQEYERGIMSQGEIARKVGVARQSLKERADREGWVYGNAAESTEIAEYRGAPDLRQCLDLIKTYSLITTRWDHLSEGMSRNVKITPERLAKALQAAYSGAKERIMADAAGLHPETLKRAMREDEGFNALVREAHATHALASLDSLKAAQDRGDSASARFLLEKGPYASDYGGSNSSGGPAINITLNIGDPKPPTIIEEAVEIEE